MNWIPLAILDQIAKVLNIPMAPIVCLFMKDCRLPWFFRWFETDGSDLRGDEGWQVEHWQWRFKLPKVLADYVGAVGWLWRNPTYTFAKEVLGFKVQEGFIYNCEGDERVSNLPLVEGVVKRTILNLDGTYAWQWYYIKAWPSKTKCVRINLGWKLWGNKQAGDTARLTFSISPFQLCREQK